ncbi:RNA-binding cell elongation regulator Jag/EloR [Paenibacillus sp. GCM10012307]|uniref:RNA-binding protein KhpB n=1 Tax=Paenibacillus roseus TaxID=2798579 RepID=A0A934J799_9BACL|nr:RNA-binding cell elongation regulator Jag/EloR [Paenibacillus roseus]MBJ6361687.1 protein jag [Paenibacillus roseus]
MKKIIASGKTMNDAVQKGLAQWQVSEERVRITVLEHPTKGLFGLIGAKEAKVELELIPDAAEETEKFFQNVARTMGLSVTIERRQTRDGWVYELAGGEDLGMLIGRRGQTLDALQYLANIVANRYSDSHQRIVLDAENFRERRRKTLEELAERLAARVIRTHKEVVLEPMSPAERKVIHAKLQNHSKVRTFSKGDEPYRRVVISVKS